MLALAGSPALSAFRIAKLLERLSALDAAVRGLEAQFVHFADLAQPLSTAERARLDELLSYGPRQAMPAGVPTGICRCATSTVTGLNPAMARASARLT